MTILLTSSLLVLFMGCLEETSSNENSFDDENPDENSNKYNQSWGNNSELLVKINLAHNIINISDSTTLNIKIINNGSNKLRVIPLNFAYLDVLVNISNENKTRIVQEIEEGKIKTPDNNDLVILKPQEFITRSIRIPGKGVWNFKNNKTYSLQCRYYAYESKQNSITLPYWLGDICSNIELLHIK